MTNSGDKYLICDFRGIFEPVSLPGLLQTYKDMNIVFLYTSESADGKIRVFHPSGKEMETSAGAVLCTATYLQENGDVAGPKVFIQSKSMLHTAFIYPEDYPEEGILIEMAAPRFHKNDFRADWKENFMVDKPFTLDHATVCLTCVFVGESYAVLFCDELSNFPLKETVQELQAKNILPPQTSVIAAHVSGSVDMEIRIYDYLQGEKLASGNGAAAAAAAAILNKLTARNVTVVCNGGNFILHILSWTNHIMLTGKVNIDGEICDGSSRINSRGLK